MRKQDTTTPNMSNQPEKMRQIWTVEFRKTFWKENCDEMPQHNQIGCHDFGGKIALQGTLVIKGQPCRMLRLCCNAMLHGHNTEACQTMVAYPPPGEHCCDYSRTFTGERTLVLAFIKWAYGNVPTVTQHNKCMQWLPYWAVVSDSTAGKAMQ